MSGVGLAETFIGMLAVWRITHLLQAEDGPWDLGLRLRRAAGEGFLARLLDCFYCSSVWVAVAVTTLLTSEWTEGILLVFGFSGGAIVIERALTPGPFYREDPQ